MGTDLNQKFSFFQTQILWIALACLAFKFLLDTDSCKDLFGSIWMTVKQANAVIMWLTAVLSGKKFIDLIERIKKAANDPQEIE